MNKMKYLLPFFLLLASCDGSSNTQSEPIDNGGGGTVEPPVTWELPDTSAATLILGYEDEGETSAYRIELLVAADKITFGDCGFSTQLPEFERIAIEAPSGFVWEVGHKIGGGVENTLAKIYNSEGWVEYIVAFRNESPVTIRPDSYTVYIYTNFLPLMEINPDACEASRSEYIVELLEDQGE